MVNIPDGQALYQQAQQEKAVHDQFLLEQAWESLQATPSYIEENAKAFSDECTSTLSTAKRSLDCRTYTWIYE